MLLETLLMFSERWKTLELSVPVVIYHKLENMLSGRTLSLLTH